MNFIKAKASGKCRICGRPLPDWYPDDICPACKMLLDDPEDDEKEIREKRVRAKNIMRRIGIESDTIIFKGNTCRLSTLIKFLFDRLS